MGPPLSERPPVPTEAERLAAKEEKRAVKDLRQAERGRRVSAERVRERARLERRVAHEALVERMKRKKEERIARERAEGKEPDEEVVRLEKALEELKREMTAERMKKLAEARVLCKKMYEEMKGRQRVRMRKVDWMVAVLDDGSHFATIMDMMQNGKSKEEIVTQSVKPSQYNEAESVAKQILAHAHTHLARQSAFWKRAAQTIAAMEKTASMANDAEEKIAIYGLSIEDLKQPRLSESQAAAQKLLDAVVLLPGIESIDPQTSFQQRVSQAQEMLPLFVKQASELRTRADNKADLDNTSFDSDILAAATAHYEDMALQLKMKISQLERFKEFMEKYPAARAIPMKFKTVVQRMKLSKNEAAAAKKVFATFYVEREGTKVTVESRNDAENVAKAEVDSMHDSVTQQKVDAQATILHGGVEAQDAENGNTERDGKESLMNSDMPGIKQDKGPINEWVRKGNEGTVNLVDMALKSEEQAEEMNARNKSKEEEEKKEREEKNGGGVFGWFRGS